MMAAGRRLGGRHSLARMDVMGDETNYLMSC